MLRLTLRWCFLYGLGFCFTLLSVLGSAGEVRNPDGVAVIIGNRSYENRDIPAVDYAHRDAQAFRAYVIEVLGFDADNIIDLRDATQAQMESAFGNDRGHKGKLWRYLNPEGGLQVVVFYSGHGVPGKDKSGYLLPVDASPETVRLNGYPIGQLYENLGKLEEAAAVRVYLDACFSGGSHRGMLTRAGSLVYVQPKLPPALQKLTVLTAASGEQLASWDEKAEHGMFTHHVLDALYGKADADKDGKDGKVSALETKRYLDCHMSRAARRTFGREQRASLFGDGQVVLTVLTVASAAGGGTSNARRWTQRAR